MTAQRAATNKRDEFWTGLPPIHGICPGMRADGTITTLPQVKLNAGREALLDYFNNSWTLTVVLFSGLASNDAYYRRPYHQLRHPLIFYYAHPAVLYVNKLRVAGLLDGPVDAAFEDLFETGVDEMRWDDLYDGSHDIWPSVTEVREYRRQVYAVVKSLIVSHPDLDQPITQQSPAWALVMSFEHERIHFETSSVLMRELPIEYICAPKEWPALADPGQAPKPQWIPTDARKLTIGKPADFPTFGWDNEYGQETRRMDKFTAQSTLVTNGMYLSFMKAGGYTDERYWTREGWAWRRFRNVKHPTFFAPDGPDASHRYKLRTIFSEIAMPEHWPVCVNFLEAKAYCAWLSAQENTDTPYRLLTEAEHHAIRADDNASAFTHGSEHAVTHQPANLRGFYDVFGNVWQWCEDHFHALPGGKPHPYYPDFSSPCYDGEHQMMLGGSFISTGDEISKFARFHFRPHFFQHAGFRVARSLEGKPTGNPKRIINAALTYETDEMLNTYMLMHWGSDAEIHDSTLGNMKLPNIVHLPIACAELVNRFARARGRVLDLGCAVGRASFELAHQFQNVYGIDYSHEFIEACERLKHTGKYAYYRKDSGNRGTALTARLDASIDRNRLTFQQGDASNLPSDLGSFDAVLMSNLLCRLSDPESCLARLQGPNALVKKGGIVVMTTPFSWLPNYTDPSRWLNGVEDVKKHLSEFELIHEQELPFMIREHQRKYEFIITKATVWRRR